MTDQTPSPYAAAPSAGWYDDPEIPGQPRWWDGTQWYPSQAPTAFARPTVGTTGSRLAIALAWLIGVQGAISLGLVGLYSWGHANLSPTAMYADTLSAYDIIDGVLGMLQSVLMLASIIVWCLWQHRLAAAAPRDRIRRSPGMHVGSWFIPIVMLWFPYQNIKDLWDAFVGRRTPMLLGGWWTLWIVSNLVSNGALRASFSGDATIREINDISLVGAVLDPGLAALAIVIVLRLTSAARAQEAEKINA